MESRIAASRGIGISINEMNYAEKRLATDNIMFNCAALFGCPLPQTEMFAQIISDELFLFLNEFGYGNLTLEEILLAMRINAKGNLKYPSGMDVQQVGFTGACFHIDFVAKMLSYYMIMRNSLERTLTNYLDGY